MHSKICAPFEVNLDICVGIYNTPNDLSNIVCVPNKTKDLNLRMFNMITEINELKTKHISCKCECKFDGRKCNSNQKWIHSSYWCQYKISKKHHVCKKDNIWNPATCSYENGKCSANIIDDSVIRYDELIEEKKLFQQYLMKKKNNL